MRELEWGTREGQKQWQQERRDGGVDNHLVCGTTGTIIHCQQLPFEVFTFCTYLVVVLRRTRNTQHGYTYTRIHISKHMPTLDSVVRETEEFYENKMFLCALVLVLGYAWEGGTSRARLGEMHHLILLRLHTRLPTTCIRVLVIHGNS